MLIHTYKYVRVSVLSGHMYRKYRLAKRILR